jgi:hypothetical protein
MRNIDDAINENNTDDIIQESNDVCINNNLLRKKRLVKPKETLQEIMSLIKDANTFKFNF